MWLMLPMYILCLVIGLTTTTFGIWYVIDGDPDGDTYVSYRFSICVFGIVLIVSYVRRINTDNRTLKYGRAIPNCVIVDYSNAYTPTGPMRLVRAIITVLVIVAIAYTLISIKPW